LGAKMGVEAEGAKYTKNGPKWIFSYFGQK